jgi:glycosyltransferase involved in cell wall biosynthesis
MNEPMRVLHVFGGLGPGGAETRTMDIYRKIDKTKVQFDFLVHSQTEGFYENEVSKMGGNVYRVPKFGPFTIRKYKKALENFFEQHSNYKIVHGHMLSTAYIYLSIAKRSNVPIRIAHSRCGSRTKITFENIVKEIMKRFSKFPATHLFAVSKVAAISAFGKRSVNSNKVWVLPNAIDVTKYKYDDRTRSHMRSKMRIESNFVIGHIGRFEHQKNHQFIIDIFKKVYDIDKNAKLILIGDGKLREEIKKKVVEQGLIDNVIFTGLRSDVPDLLQAIDAIILPSFFEGLPGVILEAQSMGLPCFISDKVTNEVKITNLVHFCPLNMSAENWAKKILEYDQYDNRTDTTNLMINANFDIKKITVWYEKFYLSHI